MVLPKDIDAYLSRRFYNPRSPASFTSASKLHSVIKREGRYNISLSRINDWAKSQDIVTLHKEGRQKPVRYRRVIAPGINHLWDCDLLVLNGERFARANNGLAYILVTIDVFSRFCRAQPVKSKSGKHVCEGFRKIFDAPTNAAAAAASDPPGERESDGDEDDESKKLPRFIWSDRGTEFTNTLVTALMGEQNIKMIFTNTETKANYAEAMIKGLKKRLFQFFQYSNSYSYADEFQNIVSSYNRTVHSSIGVSPSQVAKSNEQDIWDYQYVTQNTIELASAFRRAISSSRNKKRSVYKFAIGDKVRVSYHRKKIFSRSYDEQFTGEVFSVRARKFSDNVAVYYLNDYGGETVDGPFYSNELTAVRFDPDAFFRIEKVIRTRVRADGESESLVKYQSWPSKYNQWLPTAGLKTLKKKKQKKKN